MTSRPSPLNSLRARLLIGIGFPLVLFVAIVVVAVNMLDRLLDAMTLENHSHEVILQGVKQQEALTRMNVIVHYGPVLKPALLWDDYENNHRAFLQANTAALELVRDALTQSERLEDIRRQEEDWHRLVAGQLNGRLPPQPRQVADREPLSADEFGRLSDNLIGRLSDQLKEFIGTERTVLQHRHDRAVALTSQSRWTIGIGLLVVLLLALLVAWRVSSSVTRPIDRLRRATRQVLTGSFNLAPPEGPNEIAQLLVDFNQMALSLTERNLTLQEQEEGYRQYLTATAHLMWRTDAEGRVEEDLASWRAFTGQTAEQVRGWGWLEAVHPDERGQVRARWLHSVQERTLFEMEYRLRSAAGVYRLFIGRGVPIIAADGAVRGWIGACTDITERGEMVRLQHEKEAAEAATRAKSEFLAKMSHELRTPLNAIIGMSRMLTTQRFGPLTDKQADYLNDVIGAGEHLLALINDILDLAKIESGRMELRPEGFSVNAAVTAVLSTLRPLAAPKRLPLHQEPCQPDGEISADPARFKQVLYNLLSNAIKFTQQGAVTIRCQWIDQPTLDGTAAAEPEAAALRVEVRDTGIGIAAEDQATIWEEFRQVPSAAQQVGAIPGTGLGLALTRQLVQHMGGVVGMQSKLGEGSTFTFVLPRKPPPTVHSQPATASEAVDGTADLPLALVIEDYPATHKLLVDWLREAGLATASAFDGESGLLQARKLHPRLILLDLQLPRLDGWQVLTALKQDASTAGIPVVIVTATEEHEPPGDLMVQEFFVKPLGREEFLRRLRAVQPALFDRARPFTVLVIDDEPADRKLMSDLLTAEGGKVLTAENGRQAIEYLRGERPDLIVLDLVMPEVNGFHVVEAIRNRPDWQDVPILIVTAKDLTEEERGCLTGRIQAMMAKQKLTPERLYHQLSTLGVLRSMTASGASPHAPPAV